MGSLQDLLGCAVPAEAEERFSELLKRKVAAMASIYVEAMHAVEELYGPEAVQAVRRRHTERAVERARAQGERADSAAATGADSLRAFCEPLIAGCRGSHEWEALGDGDTRQAYRFSRCLWAEVFRDLGEPEIGGWICERDAPAVEAFDPRLRLRLTKTLMAGDDCCDHVFYVADEQP